jgi:hypothetical protein
MAGMLGRRLGLAGAALGLAGGLVAGLSAAASSAATTAPAYVTLNGVAALSSSSAWAVGSWSQTGGVYKSLIEHWNGSKWQIKASPSPGTNMNSLNAVAALSGTQAWAVGDHSTSGQSLKTLIEHWNGSSWTVQASPSPVTGNNTLSSVVALSRTSVWAVGYTLSTTGAERTLIEHWNGSSWKVQSSPSPTSTSILTGVTAVSNSNAWAVGYSQSSDGVYTKTLVEHWNGSSWNIQTSANPDVSNWLCGVVATSGTNAWTAGTYHQTSTGYQLPLMEHWNGQKWSVHASAYQPAGYEYAPCAMTATSAGNVWTVGGRWHYEAEHTLIEHWNGTAWTTQASPNPAGGNWDRNVLNGVSATSGASAWAVGWSYVNNSQHRQQLIVHWNGSTWNVQYGQMP